jgi:protein-S-isoprenylcysteine O-methyltransferase Ste14
MMEAKMMEAKHTQTESNSLLTYPVNKTSAKLMLYLSAFFGGGSFLMFLTFLFIGSFNLIKLNFSETNLLIFNAGLSMLFFVQHSTMIRHKFKNLIGCFVKDEYYSAIFSIASGMVLLIVVFFWQKSTNTIIAFPKPVEWLVRASYLTIIIGFIWSVRALGIFDPFGIRQIIRSMRGKPSRSVPFSIKGPYHYVRHPLYFLMLVLFWSFPNLTADRLLFNVLWTAWIFIGAVLEERDLIIFFGDEYRNYQKNVPMLIPYHKHSMN